MGDQNEVEDFPSDISEYLLSQVVQALTGHVCLCVCVVVSCREININTLSPRQAAMSLSLQGNREVFGDLLCWRISRELFHQVTYKQTKISLVLLLSTEHVNELNSRVPDWVLGPSEGFSNNPRRTTSQSKSKNEINRFLLEIGFLFLQLRKQKSNYTFYYNISSFQSKHFFKHKI